MSLRLIFGALALAALLSVGSGLAGKNSSGPRWTSPQVADGTEPGAPPYPLGPQVADGTEPGAPPYPLGPQVADGTEPGAPPYPLAA
ncbi:MAG TPA: hypothetical protein VLY24_22470 [Bryobacteraceae bacterium]|nr:hypothetical protein [Bryobacteraceae bacterium]